MCMDNISIKNNIRKLRKAKKMTQEAMAHSLGMSLTAYRQFESGKTSMMNENVLKAAGLLDTSAEELVLGYVPSQKKDGISENLQKEYAARIEELEQRISYLEKLVQTLEESVATKNEIISMLKKTLAKEK